MPISNVTDLDALIGADLETARKAMKYTKIKVFDREWRVTENANTYTALSAGFGDVEALAKMITSVLHPEDRDEFRQTLMAQDALPPETLMKLLNGMLEAVAGRPTKSPSASSPGRKKAPVRRRSVDT